MLMQNLGVNHQITIFGMDYNALYKFDSLLIIVMEL